VTGASSLKIVFIIIIIITKSPSEMSTNCRKAAIVKNRQEGAKRQKAGTKARAHPEPLVHNVFHISRSKNMENVNGKKKVKR